ncbi:hypothetical protein BV22DRAFT_1045630 [Leucogyrophana mollusca]|uniref:Uncharacterized protein n=1 Tax=Leucogyrophana mollusca TaxID=85980 RepID=A0ACB8BR64_9AGAM|nr:hypothetical protein BV22DRAFT_1045630 [Leucogyrophana mollusca]
MLQVQVQDYVSSDKPRQRPPASHPMQMDHDGNTPQTRLLTLLTVSALQPHKRSVQPIREEGKDAQEDVEEVDDPAAALDSYGSHPGPSPRIPTPATRTRTQVGKLSVVASLLPAEMHPPPAEAGAVDAKAGADAKPRAGPLDAKLRGNTASGHSDPRTPPDTPRSPTGEAASTMQNWDHVQFDLSPETGTTPIPTSDSDNSLLLSHPETRSPKQVPRLPVPIASEVAAGTN